MGHQPSGIMDPYIRLVAAVLTQGLDDYYYGAARGWGHREKPSRGGSKYWDFIDAKHWLHSPDVTPWSCLWCCDILDFDTEVLRDLLRPDNPRIENLRNRRRTDPRPRNPREGT